MASNLTDQVCSISEATKAVVLGDLGKLVNVDMQGEMLDLKMIHGGVLESAWKSAPRESWADRPLFPRFRECGRYVFLDSLVVGSRANCIIGFDRHR
jgi:hypothetical protein